MELNAVNGYLYRRSPSSDRFLDLFAPAKSPLVAGAGDELHEAEVFWTGDSLDSSSRCSSPPAGARSRRRLGFRQSEKSGILAALTEDDQNRIIRNTPVLSRRSSSPSSSPAQTTSMTTTTQFRTIPSIPKSRQSSNADGGGDYTHSLPASRKFQHSAPMNVPVMLNAKRSIKINSIDEIDGADEEEMLPPHEIAAQKGKTTSSVLEGVGRTLKGRDLRQVRNAVWRQTGFLD